MLRRCLRTALRAPAGDFPCGRAPLSFRCPSHSRRTAIFFPCLAVASAHRFAALPSCADCECPPSTARLTTRAADRPVAAIFHARVCRPFAPSRTWLSGGRRLTQVRWAAMETQYFLDVRRTNLCVNARVWYNNDHTL
jgi:hypothetical protein